MADCPLAKRWNARWYVTAALLAHFIMGAFPGFVHAQPGSVPGARDAAIAFTAIGLASLQPADDTFVGAPYLDKGLGGAGPGFAVGLNLIAARRFVAAAEFSTAGLQVTQAGRLVGGEAIGQARDSLFTALAGIVASSQGTTVQILAGISRPFGTPRLDNVPINQPYDGRVDPAAIEGAGSVAFTGGVDVSRAVNSRLAVVASVRYSKVPRSRRATEIGLGSNVFRAGTGVRVGLTSSGQ